MSGAPSALRGVHRQGVRNRNDIVLPGVVSSLSYEERKHDFSGRKMSRLVSLREDRKIFLAQMKSILFGNSDVRITKERFEEFFYNDDNFALRTECMEETLIWFAEKPGGPDAQIVHLHEEIIVEAKGGLVDMGTGPPFNGAKSSLAISPATETGSQKESSLSLVLAGCGRRMLSHLMSAFFRQEPLPSLVR